MSSTCLDHIYTTHPGFIADISVPNIGLSDHLLVFIRQKYSRKQKNEIHSTIECRDLKNLNTDELLQDLQCTPWDAAFVFYDIMIFWVQKKQCLMMFYIDTFHLNPNVSRDPTNLGQRRFFILWKQGTNCSKGAEFEFAWGLFTIHACEGQTTNLLRKAKRSFFREKIDENKGNPKGFWKALKSLSWTSKPRVRINKITTENELVSTKPSWQTS